MSSAARLCLCALMCLLLRPAFAWADLITNGDFEAGATGWSFFTTANGTIGSPSVVPFDLVGAGASNTLQFLVGQKKFAAGSQQGGGIYQNFGTSSGWLAISADIGAYNATIYPNGAAGLFTMMLDGVAVASWDFGPIAVGATEWTSLTYVAPVVAGTHEIMFLITRPFLAGPPPFGTPYQYVDNVSVAIVPEPLSITLIGAGVTAFGVAKLRRRQRRNRDRNVPQCLELKHWHRIT
jgi:hypothetical protein